MSSSRPCVAGKDNSIRAGIEKDLNGVFLLAFESHLYQYVGKECKAKNACG